MTTAFLDLSTTHVACRDELQAAFARVLDKGHFILGAEVEAFETEFAQYCAVPHCVGVGNGLDALHLILRAMDIGMGDEVIVPAHTFIATWLAVSQCGARPVPVEPTPRGYNIDAVAVEAAITPRTRAIIAVHLYGEPADMGALRAISNRHGLRLIEDAAQAHGARYKGQRTGGLADAAAFSFYPTKNLGALGDGGAVTTRDAALAERIRLLRNYGSRIKYQHDVAGYNTRLDELQAALLRVKLHTLDALNAARQQVAQRYLEALADIPGLRLPHPPAFAEHVWHLFVIRSQQRDRLAHALTERGVATMVHYPTPCHLQGAYRNDGYLALTATTALCEEILSLPMWPGLDPEPVIDALRDASH
ncbi:MAG: erythromycin biosynthesis sensory transduction protein eryC1 [Rhodocyclales bacterium]|nr:erythromycin biosynthesis sensory transduction protein eryC1 [Rhodocyclales bacterium]